MSRIIKGGKVRFFCFDLERVQQDEDEEVFNPLGALLPPEALEAIEEARRREEEERAEESPPVEAEPEEEPRAEGEEDGPAPEEPPPPPPLSLADVPLEELREHPEVAARLAQLEKEAYEKGYGEGFREGKRQGEAAGQEEGRRVFEERAARLEQVVRALEREIEEHVLALTPQLLSLVRAAVEAVLRREMETPEAVLEASLREALGYVVDQARVRIRLNPEDLELADGVVDRLRTELARFRAFELVPDAAVARGGCVLETDFGLVDSSPERRWQEFLRRIEEVGGEDEGA